MGETFTKYIQKKMIVLHIITLMTPISQSMFKQKFNYYLAIYFCAEEKILIRRRRNYDRACFMKKNHPHAFCAKKRKIEKKECQKNIKGTFLASNTYNSFST